MAESRAPNPLAAASADPLAALVPVPGTPVARMPNTPAPSTGSPGTPGPLASAVPGTPAGSAFTPAPISGGRSATVALTTWHTNVRPTQYRPVRELNCAGCGARTTDRDNTFPQDHKRWGYYTLCPKAHPTIKQPSGWWCWECDSLCEHQPEDKMALKGKLEDQQESEYRRVWNEEWLPRLRGAIAAAVSRGEDKLPPQKKRSAYHEEARRIACTSPATGSSRRSITRGVRHTYM